jgi:hypothetical protein
MKRRKMLSRYMADGDTPPALEEDVGELTMDLYATLSPFLKLDPAYDGTIPHHTEDWFEDARAYHAETHHMSLYDQKVVTRLFALVSQAAYLGLTMHTDEADAVYIFRDPHLDQTFDGSSVIMTNLEEMGQLKPSKEAPRLVKVSVFPEVSVYRRGGFKGEDADEGFRVRQLTKSYAHFRMGRPEYGMRGGRTSGSHSRLASPATWSRLVLTPAVPCKFM